MKLITLTVHLHKIVYSNGASRVMLQAVAMKLYLSPIRYNKCILTAFVVHYNDAIKKQYT